MAGLYLQIYEPQTVPDSGKMFPSLMTRYFFCVSSDFDHICEQTLEQAESGGV